MIDNQDQINHNISIHQHLYQNIPREWVSYDSFTSYVLSIFEKYLSLIPQFQGYIHDKIEKNPDYPRQICLNLLKVIHLSLRGRYIDAYKYLEEVFNYIKEPLVDRSSKEHPLALALYFRGRVIADEKFVPEKKDMFHIPFEQRHLVKEQRFSQYGIPAIYLGSSPYDCYIELGQPEINSLWVSLFAFNQKHPSNSDFVSLIDLTVSSDGLWVRSTIDKIQVKSDTEIQKTLDDLYNDIILWPLIHLCSVATRYPNAPFKQEYIIPKLIFQICLESTNYLGVKYQSTRKYQCPPRVPSFALTNIAFPVHSFREQGYCPTLASNLLLTDPVAFDSVNDDFPIECRFGHTHNGLPVLNRYNPMNTDKTIYHFDKLTIYFDQLLKKFQTSGNIELLSPLYGWPD